MTSWNNALGIAGEFLTGHWLKENREFARGSSALLEGDKSGLVTLTHQSMIEMDGRVLRTLAAAQGIEEPVRQLLAFRDERFPRNRPRYWAVVNFDLKSDQPRLFILDVVAEAVQSYLCAHGAGSEKSQGSGVADHFSNRHGSNASPLGICLCAETYHAKRNGYALRFDGLEQSNSNSRARHIVMHGADYVLQEFVDRHGQIGTSKGCPAVERRYNRSIIDRLKWGSLLIFWRSF